MLSIDEPRVAGPIPLPPLEYIQRYCGTPTEESYLESGRLLTEHFCYRFGLQPEEQVLDVGCGVGRVARFLTQTHKPPGHYHGIDVAKPSIEWDTAHITSRHQHFHFHHADIYSSAFNPEGSLSGCEYIFPFSDNSFDFVLLSSVFTHMLPRDFEHFLGEIARVLRPGGRCVITYLLLNEQTRELVRAKRSAFHFYMCESYGVHKLDCLEWAVSLDEDYVRRQYLRQRLELGRPIEYGVWRTNEQGVNFQDLLYAQKAAHA